jgi:hypothetical protein
MHAMGEVKGNVFEPEFNRSIKVEATDQRLTSNAGVLLLREADERLQLISSIAEELCDPRAPDRIRYSLTELIRERVYTMSLGFSAQDDVDLLCHDPAFRMAVWDRRGEAVIDERLASQPTQSRLLGMLTSNSKNLQALQAGLGDSIRRHVLSMQNRVVRQATIDIDSFPSEVHGGQAGAAYNGHYRRTMYHPLVASFSVGGNYDSTREGLRLGNGFIHAILRQGQVHTAKGMVRFLDHTHQQAMRMARHVDYRLDAGLTIGAVLDRMTEKNRRFIGRLKGNSVLDRMAEPHLKRPPGRPPAEGYMKIIELGMYQAQDWRYAQRVILVVIDEPDSETGQLALFPRHFFLVTNWREQQRSGTDLLEHYRRRGTFEDRLSEFNQAIGAHLSSPNFKENEATFFLALLAYNLTSICRNELEDAIGGCWDLRRFQQFVLRVGGLCIKKSRRLIMRIAQSAEPLWSRLVRRLQDWTLPAERTRPPNRRVGFTPPPPHAHLEAVLRP